MIELYERIKKARLRAGYATQKAASDALGVERTRYLKWETGVYSPPLDILVRMCRIYNVSSDYLLGLTDEPAPITGENLTAEEVVKLRGFLRAMEGWRCDE